MPEEKYNHHLAGAKLISNAKLQKAVQVQFVKDARKI